MEFYGYTQYLWTIELIFGANFRPAPGFYNVILPSWVVFAYSRESPLFFGTGLRTLAAFK